MKIEREPISFRPYCIYIALDSIFVLSICELFAFKKQILDNQ